MARGCKHGLSLLVADLDGLLGGIDADRDILTRHFVVTHVEPVGQVALGRAFRILDPDSVSSYGFHRQTPLAEGSLSCDMTTDEQQQSS